MKLSVRTKVANGLVIFLLLPRAAETAQNLLEEYRSGLDSFGAEDNFDLGDTQSGTAVAKVKQGLEDHDPTGGDPTGGDPSGYDPSGFDPSGFDPSGGDPSGCEPDPNGGAPTMYINAPRELVTAEDGTADLFEMLMTPDPEYGRTYRIVSTRPEEARPFPKEIVFADDACIPQPVWVTGQNDYGFDGDQDYVIEIYDEQDLLVSTIKGVNLDNDNFKGVAVDVLGPNALPEGETGRFLVRAANVSGVPLEKNTLLIEGTANLDINEYAVALLSGAPFKAKAKMKNGLLVFSDVALQNGDMLIVSMEVEMARAGKEEQSITARFVHESTGEETSDDQGVRSSRP
ncbi:MAG: hypothetical protein MUE63_00665 [Xanthomonadales bacterium]|jgi:hypothetical protein|nr:hypothetical protein [Xanthomonadales bacterium]